MLKKFAFAIFIWLLLMPVLQGQSTQQGSRVFQNKRVALVVGNSDYLIGPLKNPVNDARAMKTALEKTGFEVLYYENITNKDNFTRAVRTFGQKLQNGEVGLFYFAGHGLQVKGINYLVPIKAEVLSEPEVEFECLDVGFVLAQMEAANNRMNIVILDACRNNPFARSFRSADRGLATMMAPTGTLIAYATAPGSVAADGDGSNGLYTEKILKQITKPGLKIEEVFKNVRAEVVQVSNNRQVPWESSSLIGDFYFNLSNSQESAINSQNQIPSPIQNQNQIERNTQNKEDFTQIKGQPEINKPKIGSSSTNYWYGANNMYWLMVNGENIELDTYSQWMGTDLLVTHKTSGKSYLLKEFYKNSDSQWREAPEVDISNLSSLTNYSNSYDLNEAYANWIGSNEGFWMYLNGNDITQEVTSEWQNQHLKVYHARSGMTFLLRDYYSGLDKLVRPAEILLDARDKNRLINVQWRAFGTTYWFAINGIDHTQNSYSQFEGNDLVIYHRPSGKRFRVYNYSMFLDNRWRPIYPEN